ncbi:MAG TPA: hypothetical protein VHN80_12130, partial [Kineosporiaceae bacterium]|nr:hypothetical protein [Kineosporiaceae bacterium]
MDEKSKMVDAHVQFELGRWSGAALQESVTAEVGLLFDWLASVRLGDLVTAEQVSEWVQRIVVATPPSDEFARTIDECIRVVYQALLLQDVSVSDLLPRQNYEQHVDAIVEMRQIRPEVVTQITTTSVYSQLVAHLLYRGIKTYLVTENAIARKIPGASSLFRMGQHAMASAAPGLEKSIDNKLISFINGNVKETIGDSSAFLNKILDDAMIRTLADEVWAGNSGRTLASAVELLASSSLDDAVVAGRGVWLHLRETAFFREFVAQVVQEIFRLHGDKPVGVLLGLLGVTPVLVAREVGAAAEPIVEQARNSGYLEARIRSRLDAFYCDYFHTEPVPRPAAKPAAAKSTARPAAAKSTARPAAAKSTAKS